MLFDYYDTDRLVICLDTANVDLMEDFFSDRSQTRLLEIECEFTDDYLRGHALRVGLAGEHTTEESLARLLPTLRQELTYETDRIRDANFPNHYRLRERVSPAENAEPLASFLSVNAETARALAETPYLFVD